MQHSDLHPDPTALIRQDPWLQPYQKALERRCRNFAEKQELLRTSGNLEAYSLGFKHFGFNRGEKDRMPGIWYREWAPGAKAMFLIGDFNDWDRRSHPMSCDSFGVWQIFIPDSAGEPKIPHASCVKVHVMSENRVEDRIPAYIRHVAEDPETHNFSGLYWDPPEPYEFLHAAPKQPKSLRIYEAHVGMSSEEPKIASFDFFRQHVLSRIQASGYNAVQLMACMQHPYYGSFGYQVANFFAVSHFFGSPESLMQLIDEAHARGLLVFLDLVHSHAVANVNEGLNRLDGTDFQYFHAGPRGTHPAWDSKLFDYSKPEVLRFLLSNVRYWMDEFHFDGFRFDGVTSMMYLDHGLGRGFHDYDAYFNPDNLDEDAISYLQLANQLVHELNPEAITIAEDVSGMPGIARPLSEGGVGFDYRLAMGIPDYWIRLLKTVADDSWPMDELFHVLTNRRFHEKHIAYCESHDQALVGDKTLSFRLMDAAMYSSMHRDIQDPIIDRGMALHKMIRLVSFALGGSGWLNFIGNEFGHPEWIDFPREGNGFSFAYARRQWSLPDHPDLRYSALGAFDVAMQHLDRDFGLLCHDDIEKISVHEKNKLLVFRRGHLIFLFNFHPTQSQTDLPISVPKPHDYRIVLDTDKKQFGGFGRNQAKQTYPIQEKPEDPYPQEIKVYLPCRTAQVLQPQLVNGG